jgi:hypothetical protein
MLAGGHPNSHGRTPEVVDLVLADRTRLDELFATLGDPDAVVRLRAGDALEKVCAERPGWFAGRVEQLLGEVAEIDQPSVQWHVAQMLDHLAGGLSPDQRGRAVALLQRNLTESSDWIVLNVTMAVLAGWAAADPELAAWLRPQLERLSGDERRSVARRAQKLLARG